MKKSASVDNDRISNLPNELLSHILSLLPIEQAFTTTLLSKRWTSLCYSLSVLHFIFDDAIALDDDDYDNVPIDLFSRFVDTFMLSPHAINQPIKTFHLKCLSRVYNVDRKSFHAWVHAAKQRNVKEFHLFMNNETLNHTIFTSQTLVVLKLERLKVKARILRVHLPSLKTLHLKFVSFGMQSDFIKILNACPILQDLHTTCLSYRRHDENSKSQQFKSLFLSKLVRADIGLSDDVSFTAIANVDFLHIRDIERSSFKDIPLFRNLIHIELWFCNSFHDWVGIVSLLQHCPKLQILFIKKCVTGVSKDWECPISAFECVSYHLRSCTILNFEDSDNDLQFATYILRNARLLEVMKINVKASSSNDQIMEKLSTCPRMSPSCKLSF